MRVLVPIRLRGTLHHARRRRAGAIRRTGSSRVHAVGDIEPTDRREGDDSSQEFVLDAPVMESMGPI